MALTSMTCVDSLSFKFSLHRLEDAYVPKPPYYYSWSEPFLPNFAGKTSEGSPKRSKSQPSTLVGPVHSLSNASKKGDQKLRSVDIFRDLNPAQYRRKTEVSVNTCTKDFYSNSSTSAIDLPLTGCNYVNENATKTSRDCEDDFTSDEELAELCCGSQDTKDALPKKTLVIERKNIVRKENIGIKATRRKRTLDTSDEFTEENVVKRSRPRLDFEKMRLSMSETLNQNCSTEILLDEIFFKPILPTENSQ